MKELTREKGITLIALIITIIVMLILVGVTINVALNGGLFDKAKDAAKDMEEQAMYEQIVMGMQLDGSKIDIEETYNEAVKSLKGYTIEDVESGTNYRVINVVGKNGTYTYTITDEEISIGNKKPQEILPPEIGQVINQSGTALQFGDLITYNNETWVVLYNDDTNGLQIIKSETVSSGVELKGKNGFETGIDKLNKACEVYIAKGAEYARIVGTSPTFYKDEVNTVIDDYGVDITGVISDNSDIVDFEPFTNLFGAGKITASGDFILGVKSLGGYSYLLSIFENNRFDAVGLCNADEISGEVLDTSKILSGYQMFPVMIMNKNIEITGGDGTTTPYTYTFNQ